jgi:Chaperone of endosialidase
MNRLITSHYSLLTMFRWRPYFIVTAIALGCFALYPTAQAVNPAPDGGYPGANTAEGEDPLLSLTTGRYNTAIGWLSLRSITTGQFNTGVGAGTLYRNTGDQNTASGAVALFNNTTGQLNTATGAFALFSNTTGNGNTAAGDEALFTNTSGSFNTASGGDALGSNITGNGNTAIGSGALFNDTGSNNTALGNLAGSNLTTGDNNVDIGYNVFGVASESNTIRIGNTDITDTFIRGISGATSSGGAAVFVNSNGKLGTMTSSARFKDEIKPMDNASKALYSLKPVSFRYKNEIDPARTPQLGLVAEAVEKVNPDLVIRDAEGRPQTVRYEQINAMLLNEFLKEHKTVQQQQAAIAELKSTVALQRKDFEAIAARQQKEIQTLTAGFTEQAAEIQRVSVQMEVSNRGPGVVMNDPRRVKSNPSSQ